jgi:hypothetical protein
MEGKYCMSVGMQLNIFYESKLSVRFNYVWIMENVYLGKFPRLQI